MAMDATRIVNRMIALLNADGQDFPNPESEVETRKAMGFLAQAIIEEIETYYEPPP